MLHYNRIDLNERIDVAKSNSNKKCIVCCCWFFNHGFKFQDFVCNGCHDLTMMCLNVNHTAIIIFKNVIVSYFWHLQI